MQLLVYREKSSGERTQPWGAPVLIVRVLDENFPSLTSCCLSVRKLLIHWQLEVGTESWGNLGWRSDGMMLLKAEPSLQTGSSHKSLVCPDTARWSAVPCWLHHPQTCLLCTQTAGGPVRVQCRPSDKPKPVFQIILWPQTLESHVFSH